MTMLPNLSEVKSARIVVYSADMVQDGVRLVILGAGMVILSADMVFLHCVFYVFLLLLCMSVRMVLLSAGIVSRCK